MAFAGKNDPPSAPVTVVNTPLNPVLVSGVVLATKSIEPVKVFVQATVDSGNTAARALDAYVVPTGKRLVVEYLSCNFLVVTGDAMACGLEFLNANNHFMMPTLFNTSGTNQSMSSGQAVKIIFEEGEHVTFFASWTTSANGGWGANFSFSGYLEDAP